MEVCYNLERKNDKTLRINYLLRRNEKKRHTNLMSHIIKAVDFVIAEHGGW